MAGMAAKGAQASSYLRQSNAAKRRVDLLPVIQDLLSKGNVSLRAVAAGLNESGLTTARGKSWTATQVARVIDPPKSPMATESVLSCSF